jgi:hypothetical protein
MRPNSTGWVASTVQRIFGPAEVITIFGGDRSDEPKPLSVQEKLYLARLFVEDYQARITGSIDTLQISVSSLYADTAAFADLCEKLGANHLPIDLGTGAGHNAHSIGRDVHSTGAATTPRTPEA